MKLLYFILICSFSFQLYANEFRLPSLKQTYGILKNIKIDNYNRCKTVKYERKSWKHWLDTDRDCQNTRHEVLIEESKSKPTFKDSRKCSVLTGHWYDGFTGRSVQKASELHIDHLVALKNAHDSGGCLWNSKIKAAYANDMGFEFHLNAMIGRTNTSKGSHGPEKWRPPKRSSWCLYARAWSYVKYRWRLSMTSQERQSLYGMLKYCRQF